METNTVNPTRRLERGDGPIGGVAAGLADYFDLDPTVVRVGLVAGALVGFPVVPITYLAAWMIIPRAETSWAPTPPAPVDGQPIPPAPAPMPPPPATAPAPVPPAPAPVVESPEAEHETEDSEPVERES